MAAGGGAAQGALRAGQEVRAFYHASFQPDGHRFARVFERAGSFPIVGYTSAWLPATVVGVDRHPIYPRAHLYFPGTFRDPRVGYREGLDLALPLDLVEPADQVDLAGRQPLLSILALRWHDYWSNGRWSDFSVTNDGMFVDLFDGPCSPMERLPGAFEVVTAFVRDTGDLRSLCKMDLRPLLTGQKVAAWYFLWPLVSLEDELRGKHGCVVERELFRLCQRQERSGLRTCWPHASHVYRLLCGKLWVPQMSLNPAFKVPPTVRLHFADFGRGALPAAERALRALLRLRSRVWGLPAVALDEFVGVAKLGFSWQGDDVLPFRGPHSLALALQRLFEQRGSEQVSCLVQEMVQGVVGEFRILAFRDAARGRFHRERLWVRMKGKERHHVHKCDLGNFALASANVVPRDKVAQELFGGDAAAHEAAEAEAEALAGRWLAWFRTEGCEPPAVVRMDFLAARTGPGRACAWTCEVGECGASLCSVEVDGRNTAALNAALSLGPREPLTFPESIPRNNGWKS